MERVQQVKTELVKELCTVETRLDVEHSGELVKLRSDLTERLLSDLVANKEGLAADLQHEGLYGTSPLCVRVRSHRSFHLTSVHLI